MFDLVDVGLQIIVVAWQTVERVDARAELVDRRVDLLQTTDGVLTHRHVTQLSRPVARRSDQSCAKRETRDRCLRRTRDDEVTRE